MRYVRKEVLYNVGTDRLNLTSGFGRLFFVNFLFDKLINVLMDKSLKRFYVEKVFYDILFLLKLKFKFLFDSYFFSCFLKSLLVNFRFLHTYKSGKLVKIPVIQGQVLSIFNGLRFFKFAVRNNLMSPFFKERFICEFLVVGLRKFGRFFRNLVWLQKNSMWLQLRIKYNLLVFSVKHNLRFLKSYKDFSVSDMILQKLGIGSYGFYNFFKFNFIYLDRKFKFFENSFIFRLRNFWLSCKINWWKFLKFRFVKIWKYVYVNCSLYFYWVMYVYFKYIYIMIVLKFRFVKKFYCLFRLFLKCINMYSRIFILHRLFRVEVLFYRRLLDSFKRVLIKPRFVKHYFYKSVFKRMFDKLIVRKKLFYKTRTRIKGS